MATHTLPPSGWEIADAPPEGEETVKDPQFEPGFIGPRSFTGILYPVFLTAKIPTETLNRCFSRNFDYTRTWNEHELSQLHLVTSDSGKPDLGFGPTFVVDESFTPPAAFLGKTMEEIRDHWRKHWQLPDGTREWPHRSERCFVVLDEQTLKDDTALLVAVNEGDQPSEIARSEFDLICMVLGEPENNGSPLDEEEFLDKKRGIENGILVYRVWWHKKEIAFKNGVEFEDDGTINYDKPDEDVVYGAEWDENGFDDDHPNYEKTEEEVWEARENEDWEDMDDEDDSDEEGDDDDDDDDDEDGEEDDEDDEEAAEDHPK